MSLVALAALRHRRALALFATAWVFALVEQRPRHPAHVAVCVADDLISGVGTRWSCLRHRTAKPLLPRRR